MENKTLEKVNSEKHHLKDDNSDKDKSEKGHNSEKKHLDKYNFYFFMVADRTEQ